MDHKDILSITRLRSCFLLDYRDPLTAALNTGQQQVGVIALLRQWFLLGRSPSQARRSQSQGECTLARPVLTSNMISSLSGWSKDKSFEEKGDEDEKADSALGSRRWRG